MEKSIGGVAATTMGALMFAASVQARARVSILRMSRRATP